MHVYLIEATGSVTGHLCRDTAGNRKEQPLALSLTLQRYLKILMEGQHHHLDPCSLKVARCETADQVDPEVPRKTKVDKAVRVLIESNLSDIQGMKLTNHGCHGKRQEKTSLNGEIFKWGRRHMAPDASLEKIHPKVQAEGQNFLIWSSSLKPWTMAKNWGTKARWESWAIFHWVELRAARYVAIEEPGRCRYWSWNGNVLSYVPVGK